MKRPLTAAQLAAVVREAFGPDAVLAQSRELTEGTFNAAHLLELADGRTAVVKAAPPAGTRVLTYEHGLLATEALCLRAFAGLAPVPELLHAGLGETAIGRDFVVTSVVPGALPPCSPTPSGTGSRCPDARRRCSVAPPSCWPR